MSHNPEEAMKAQKRFTEKNELPHFAPTNGICWGCRRNIYSAPRGYTVERAGEELITGCPHCHKSYVD